MGLKNIVINYAYTGPKRNRLADITSTVGTGGLREILKASI
jgi:arsenate reductase-like glutaredoxin family protein